MEVFATVYWSVLVAELIGDKSIYTVTSLALRFPRRTVMAAIVAAYAVKMACAVLLGKLLLQLPPRVPAIVSAVGFLGAAAMTVLRKDDEEAPQTEDWRRGAFACFLPLFVTEWLDPGQLVTVSAAARTGMLGVVWLAGTMAMTTKGTLALLFGVKLREYVPQRMIRAVAAVSLTVLGFLALLALYDGAP